MQDDTIEGLSTSNFHKKPRDGRKLVISFFCQSRPLDFFLSFFFPFFNQTIFDPLWGKFVNDQAEPVEPLPDCHLSSVGDENEAQLTQDLAGLKLAASSSSSLDNDNDDLLLFFFFLFFSFFSFFFFFFSFFFPIQEPLPLNRFQPAMEDKVWEATKFGNEPEVRKILKENQVNWQNESNLACENGRVKIVPLLMAHPDIDANHRDNKGNTPFLFACANGKAGCVERLLADPRIKPNEPNDAGRTPLCFAAGKGYLEVIKWWIASGREMDLGQPGANSDAIGAARGIQGTGVAPLLERFQVDPKKIRSEIRKELGITGEF